MANKKPASAPIEIPLGLDTREFRSIWEEWRAERKERGKTMTGRAEAMQLKKLARFEVKSAIEIIEQSIEKGWTGLVDRGWSPRRIPKSSESAPDTPSESVLTLESWLRGRNEEFDWKRLFKAIRALVDEESYSAWIEPLRPGGFDKSRDRVALLAPSSFHRNWVRWEYFLMGNEVAASLKYQGFPEIEVFVAKENEEITAG